jgi:hypothetical protein
MDGKELSEESSIEDAQALQISRTVFSQEERQELESIWLNIFNIVRYFIKQSDKFGFDLIEKNITPSLEDMIRSTKLLSFMLDFADCEDDSDERKLLNVQQHVLLFEQISLCLKRGDRAQYDIIIDMLRSQSLV